MSNSKRKTFESLGPELGLSGDTISRLATCNANSIEQLIDFSQKIFGRKKIYLLMDDTLLLKIYSQCIEGTSDNYSSGDRRQYRSLCSIIGMLTDGLTAIPIDQIIWTSREFCVGQYQKKWELAQQLILNIESHISVQALIADGLYAVQAFMVWLNNRGINFEMRCHSNRKIVKNGSRFQLKECRFLYLRKGRTEKTIKAQWLEMNLFFTSFKRLLSNGRFITVFQVSNFKASAKKHVMVYGYRWAIEKFFRTAKQKLGLNDCQSRKIERQKGHIVNVFIAYALAQYERIKHKLKNVETAIKSIKLMNSRKLKRALCRFKGIFLHV